jgi:hypothetical protein
MAGLQLPGQAGVAAQARSSPARAQAPAFFPLGPTVGACPCRKCIATSATDSWSRPEANGMTENASPIFVPC